MSTWTIAAALLVLVLLPRLIQGQTPQDSEEDSPRRYRSRESRWAHRRNRRQ